jgi:ligand-binding sensor domain-containing protein
MRRHIMLDYDHESPRAVDWVAGAAMMVRREALDDVGPMDERYFLYFEDVDWCQRMQARGWLVQYVPAAVMTHGWQRASGALGGAARRHLGSGLRFYDRWGGLLLVLRRNAKPWRTAALLTVDLIAVAAAFLLAYTFRQRVAFILHKPLWSLSFYSGFFAASVLVTMGAFALQNLYRDVKEGDWVDLAFRVIRGTTLGALILMASTFILDMRSYSRAIVLGSWPLAAVLVFLGRRALHAAFARARRDRWNLRRVALLGVDPSLDVVERTLRERPELGWEPVRLRRTPWLGLPPHEAESVLLSRLAGERVSDVVITPASLGVSEEALAAKLLPLRRAGLGVRVVSSFVADLPPRARVERVGDTSWLTLEGAGLRPAGWSKRALDVASSSLLLALGAIPFMLLGAARLAHGGLWGPSEAWVGRGGETISVRRLSGKGRLRSLPLLLDVLRGRLSLVGPRPLRPGESVPGGEPWQRVRESHRPGLVGPWTLAPAGSPDDEMRQELSYLEEWTPESDLKLLTRVALQRSRGGKGNGAVRTISAQASAVTLIAGLVLALAAAPGAHAQNVAEAFTPHVNAGDLRDIAVDASGRLWIASNGGALRFDPVTGAFTQYPRLLGTGPRGNDLVTVAIDQTGKVWFGSATRGFTFYDPTTGEWDRRVADDWSDPRIRVIRSFGAGVYVGTQDGLTLKPTPNRSDVCASAAPGCLVPSYVVNDFALVGTDLWVATQSGLGRYNGESWDSPEALPPYSVDHNALSLAVFDGTLWEAASSGVRRLVGGEWDTTAALAVRIVATGGSLFALNGTQVLEWNSAGETWGAATLPVTPPADVRDVEIVGGTIYLATAKGLAFGPRGSASGGEVRVSPGPALVDVYAGIAIDSEGTVWAGTQGGDVGLVRFDGSAWSVLRAGDKLGGDWIFDVLSDSEGRIWIGHCCCSALDHCQVEFGSGTEFAKLPTLRNAFQIAEDSQGRIWGGTDRLGAFVLQEQGTDNWQQVLDLTQSGTGGALASNSVRAIAVTDKGTYFGNLLAGLDYWPHGGNLANGSSGSNWVHVGDTGLGLYDLNVGAIAPAGNDVWVGTSTGLHRFRDGILLNRCQTSLSDLIDDQVRSVTALVADRLGGLWVGTTNGLLHLPRGGACNQSQRGFALYTDENSALPGNLIYSGALNPKDGSVWFGTASGLVRVDPAKLNPGDAPEDQYVLYPNPMDLGLGRRVTLGIEIAGTLVQGVALEDFHRPEVFDLTGRKIGEFDSYNDRGRQTWVWTGKNLNGDSAVPGLYLVRARAATGETVVLKLGVRW